MSDGLLLAIDIGNTNTVLGVFDGHALRASWRLATFRERTSDEFGFWVRQFFETAGLETTRLGGVVVSSVVPPLIRTVQAMVAQYLTPDPLIIDGDTETGMLVLYDNPAEVGADRLVNGVAAFERYGRASGRPVVVVDFGTATTLDVITAAGEYLGGVICPGVQISAEALFERASRLPRVDVRRPPRVIGRTTIGSMESGLYYGYAGLVNGMVARVVEELGDAPVVIATGGLADVLAAEIPLIEHLEPELTLYGLQLVWSRNRT